MILAVAYPHANLDTIPSLVAVIEMLANAGHAVDIYTVANADHLTPRFAAADRIRLRPIGRDTTADLDRVTANVRALVKRGGWLPGAARGPLGRSYRALGVGLQHGSRLAARARGALRTQPTTSTYGCVIGVDPDGLDLADRLAAGAPLVYFSLELLLSDEITTPSETAIKARERELTQRASFVIVQDAERGRLLAEDNHIPTDRLVLLPNAPPGPARRRPNRYWHERFGLAPDTRVVLHSGSLGDWTGIESILTCVSDWPRNWVLVVHTRYDAESSGYVDGLRAAADPQRVHFSLRPVPRQDYDALIDGADIGLAFYVPSATSSFTQRNVQTIGLSSGKLAYYLRSGLPVIVNRATSLGDALEVAGCGVAVKDAASIPQALMHIEPRWSAYSDAACAFFAEHLNIERAFAVVLDRMAALHGVA
ncbi:MAG: hypothetical protein NVSMB2_24190 [Chloroflexota bacterium]